MLTLVLLIGAVVCLAIGIGTYSGVWFVISLVLSALVGGLLYQSVRQPAGKRAATDEDDSSLPFLPPADAEALVSVGARDLHTSGASESVPPAPSGAVDLADPLFGPLPTQDSPTDESAEPYSGADLTELVDLPDLTDLPAVPHLPPDNDHDIIETEGAAATEDESLVAETAAENTAVSDTVTDTDAADTGADAPIAETADTTVVNPFLDPLDGELPSAVEARLDGEAPLDGEASALVDAPLDPPTGTLADVEVWVIDEHPRYHCEGCDLLDGEDAESISLVQAVEDGFIACGLCDPPRETAA